MTQKLKNNAINQEITVNVFFIKIGTKKCQDAFPNDKNGQFLYSFFFEEFCQEPSFFLSLSDALFFKKIHNSRKTYYARKRNFKNSKLINKYIEGNQLQTLVKKIYLFIAFLFVFTSATSCTSKFR